MKSQIKVPPHNLEAEQAVLSAMFINPGIRPKAKKDLTRNDFYREAHSIIFDALTESDGDLLVIQQALKEKNLLEKVGGDQYLINVSNCASTSVGIDHHVRIVKKLSALRGIINLCQISTEGAFQEYSEPEEILSGLKSGIKNMLSSNGGPEYLSPNDLIRQTVKDIEKMQETGKKELGPLSGFADLDRIIGGFEPKSLTYIIGRPSMGKTALGLNMADYMVENYPGKILFFSLEMGDRALTRRRMSCKSGVFLSRIRHGDISDSQWPLILDAANKLSNDKLIIIDHTKYKIVENIVSLSETLAMESDITAIFVDHIQLMRSSQRSQSRHLEISYISNKLKDIAKDLDVPIFVLCQLRREIEGRSDKHPKLSDMKESGDLEQDAEYVIAIYRQDIKEPETDIGILKGRDTGTGKLKLMFDRFIQKFTDDITPPE